MRDPEVHERGADTGVASGDADLGERGVDVGVAPGFHMRERSIDHMAPMMTMMAAVVTPMRPAFPAVIPVGHADQRGIAGGG
jgi:hypothetical protein